MIRLLIAIALVSSAQAQGDLAAAAKSPYGLEHYINTHRLIDWTTVYTELGIDARHVLLPACADSSGRGQPECAAKLITVPVPKQAIVRLQHIYGSEVFFRYLAEGDHWKFAGSFSCSSVREVEPSHRVLSVGNKAFLIVTSKAAVGSGVATNEQSWIDLTRPGMNAVLTFTSSGYASAYGFGISRDFKATLLRLEKNPERIVLARSVRYSTDPDEAHIELGSVHGIAAYERGPDGSFHYAVGQSTFPEHIAEALFELGDEALTDEEFLHYDFANLQKIAMAPNSPAKHWLAKFLTTCENTAEKRELQSMLAK